MSKRASVFELIEHTADVGLCAVGPTAEEAFCQAARGLFAVMIDLDTVEPTAVHHVTAKAANLPALLVEWLSDLLAQKDLTELVFCRFVTQIGRMDSGWGLRGSAWGERLDAESHGAKLEVKGISYLGLSVEQEDGDWAARCVLDV